MTHDQIAARLEGFVRRQFTVTRDDPCFSRRASLFRDGYVDSLGVVELLAFINDDFGVEVPDEALVPDNFETIDDIARVIHGLVDGRREHGLTEAPTPPPPGAPRRESSRDGGPGSSVRA